MNDKTKAQVAFAEAVIQAMWLDGLITKTEREKIAAYSRNKLQAANC